MSKRLDEYAMKTELSRSAFFQQSPPRANKHPATVDSASAVERSQPEAERTNERSNDVPVDNLYEQSDDRAISRPNERTNHSIQQQDGPPRRRRKERHSFDIFADQLLALKQIAVAREAITGARVLLGDLVQEALDHFIQNETRKEHQSGDQI